MNKRIKVAILGGSALATPLLFDAMGRRDAQAAYEFVLLGRDAERLELVQRVSQELIGKYPQLEVKVSASRSQEQGLEGADFCLNQIRVGGLEGRAFDETFPRQFGIPGEETVGPGGFNNSLRSIPVVLENCRLIEKVAPNVVMLNLTNPSSIVQYAIRRYSKVNVIGACDAPVSLMEMIARLLGAPAADLQFELGGMHHFTWVTGVEQQGRQRLPEALERIEKLPKLGSDAELIRALGAIPSVYFKYYFHPDRVLAASEGRAIRAHQLMELAEQMLADFRRWHPGGGAPKTLTQRGAVWYDKIVVPTLLALAEGASTELVLSVDNRDTLPWLPEGAIVEAPVPIQGGKLQAPRGSQMPQDIKALIARNCAYEMLAAEAIVEKDRDKALRALMSNLMVSNFNQARGILSLIWPSEEKSQFKMALALEKEATKETLKVPRLHYGNDLIETFSPPEDEVAIITMEEPWQAVKDRFGRPPAVVLFVRELDWYQLEAMERALPEVGAVVGLGGGTAQDAAKYVAWRRHIPVDEIVSITSVDASVTKSIAARAGGHVTYIGYIVPRNVYIDYPLIQGAPPRLNRSGAGDILCAHTALWDWKLAHESTGESYDPEAVEAMHGWLRRVIEAGDDIRNVTQKGIQTVMEAFAEISIICRRYGSSRPQEASDHTFAYNAEFQTHKSFLHGELVALGSYVMASFQDNDPDFLRAAYQRTGLLWRPAEIGMTRDEFVCTLKTLNWYQKNFGRRYSILDEKTIDSAFIDRMVSELELG